MIKFFRRIRQSQIIEGKPGKYLGYAFGEIFLVVIGILIALQINNWNEKRKAYQKSRNYLSEIIKDLEADTISINQSIGYTTKYLNSEKWALSKTQYSISDADSLWYCLGGFYGTIPLTDRTFQKIQNSGDSNLPGYESLYDSITYYYTTVCQGYNSFYEWDKKSNLEGQQLMNELTENVEISNLRMAYLGSETKIEPLPEIQDSKIQQQLLIDFAASPKGRNHFKDNYIRHSRGLTKFVQVKSETIKLIALLKKNLNTSK